MLKSPWENNMNFTIPDGIKFNKDVADRLKECDDFLNTVPYKERDPLIKTIEHCFDILMNLGEPELFTDFAPLSFTFKAGGLFGGMIYHGPHDGFGSGGEPTFSVCVDKAYGWRLHT